MQSRREAFGLRVATLRMRNNVTQAELARRIGSSQVQISRWETGKVFPGAPRRRALAQALGVSDWQLLEPTDAMGEDHVTDNGDGTWTHAIQLRQR